MLLYKLINMVGIAQLAERQIVVLDVAGSSPVIHPLTGEHCSPLQFTDGSLAQLVEHQTFNLVVQGSSPW